MKTDECMKTAYETPAVTIVELLLDRQVLSGSDRPGTADFEDGTNPNEVEFW